MNHKNPLATVATPIVTPENKIEPTVAVMIVGKKL